MNLCMPFRAYAKVEVHLHSFFTSTPGAGNLLQCPAAVPKGKIPVSTMKESGCVSEPVWTPQSKENFLGWGRNLNNQQVA